MRELKISPFQFFVLIYLFEIGTAVLVGLGMQAKQDAWLAILIGMVGGMGLFCIYHYICRQFSNHVFTSCILKICSKYIGYPTALCYILWFAYDAARDLRDVGELILITMPETHLFIVNLFMILLCCYAVIKGVRRSISVILFSVWTLSCYPP